LARGTAGPDAEKEAIVNLNSVMIGSEDPQRLIDYYTKLFGQPGYQDGGFAGWSIGEGNLSVGPHSEVHGKNAHPGRHLLNIETGDVKGDAARFVAAGAIVIREPYSEDGWPADTYVATFADPDDNYFQLTSPFEGM
jgi:predicted enzyme related to lactoylglutathione lyase